MPLTRGQIAALEAIAVAGNSHGYVGGSTLLNAYTARYSEDIDIFHDRAEGVADSADADAARLASKGFAVHWTRRESFVRTLLAERDGETVKIEWVADRDFRFFPTMADDLFGYTAHPIDLAMNKTQAAADALRDIVDLVSIHETVLSLGAVTWAAVEKSPGFTPEGLIEEIRRNQWHTAQERQRLTAAEGAEQPDPDRLGDYVAHAGSRGGRWPDNPAIADAMRNRYRRPG